MPLQDRRVTERPHVLIAGGGIAGVEALLALRAVAGQGPSIELLSPDPNLAYRPLRVAEPFGLGRMQRFPLAEIAADQRATLRLGSVTSVDPDGHRARQRSGGWLPYDVLLIAIGAKPRNAVPGALLFHGRGGTNDVAAVLEAARGGRISRLAFAVPPGTSWPLPLYELALLTAWRLQKDSVNTVTLVFVTPEEEPLHVFGTEAAARIRALLDERGIECRTGVHPVEADGGRVLLAEGESIRTDSTITFPCLEGRRIFGLPADSEGFVPVDAHGRVEGVEDVYVVGDAANYPVKQGGLATQQADAAAEAIAAQLGGPGPARPFRPVLRAVLLTGSAPLYLRANLHDEHRPPEVTPEPLWTPPGKIAGRYLSPYLAQLERPPPDPADVDDRDLPHGVKPAQATGH
jgi:sulfide:quinone oxidoreductase